MSQRDSEPNSPLEAADRVIAIGRATLRNVDFRRARFDRFVLTGCLFLACDFRGVRLDRRYQALFAAVPPSLFRDCHFDGADLRRIRPDQSRFERCTFDDALLDGWKAEAAEFIDCRFAGAVGSVTFYGRAGGAHRPRGRVLNEFRGNDFSDAELDGVTFARGVDLAAQRLPPPDDTQVRLARLRERIARARSEIRRWDDAAERAGGLEMLRALDLRYRDQDEIISPRVSKRGPSARIQVRVWTVLERPL